MPTEHQLAELKFGTIRALESYIDELGRSKDALGRVIVPSAELINLLEAQKNAESQAHYEYERLRQLLFKAIGYR